ncbi:MAG: flagellar biosynthesis regulator FlaF [Pseudomonadota bacterium]
MQAEAYVQVHQMAPGFTRDQERQAFDHALDLLENAQSLPSTSNDAMEALRFCQKLWGFLIKDLSDPANDLPEDLRGNLISIGLWVLRETDAILAGKSQNWKGVIDINRTVREGLAQ